MKDLLNITGKWWLSILCWLFALALSISWGGILYLMGTSR